MVDYGSSEEIIISFIVQMMGIAGYQKIWVLVQV
jgi:hypothetical protein